MGVNAVTDSRFSQDVLDVKGQVVLVDFWAPWCGPCRMLAPVIEAMATRFPTMKVLKLNTDENPETAQHFQITGIPCCIVFKDGKEVSRIVGYRSESAFADELKPFV